MKQIFTTAIFFFLVNFTINAQYLNLGGQPSKTNTQAVETECRQLKQILKLDDDQYQKIVQIKTEWQKNLDVVNMMYPEGADDRNEKIKELELQYDGEFAAVLNDKQFDQYLIKMGRPQNEETANWFLEMEAQAAANRKKNTPGFNEKVHAMLQQAKVNKPDSAVIAMKRLHDEYNSTALEELGILDSAMVNGQPAIAQTEVTAPVADADNNSGSGLVIPEKAKSQDEISLLNNGDLDGNTQPASIATTTRQASDKIPESPQSEGLINGSPEPLKSTENTQEPDSELISLEPETPATPGPDVEQLADLPESR